MKKPLIDNDDINNFSLKKIITPIEMVDDNSNLNNPFAEPYTKDIFDHMISPEFPTRRDMFFNSAVKKPNSFMERRL
jgi:hypothetical protein